MTMNFRFTLATVWLLTNVHVAIAVEWWPMPYEIEVLASAPAQNLGHISLFSVDLGHGREPMTARIGLEGSPLNKYRTAVTFQDKNDAVAFQKNFVWHAWEVASRDLDGDNINEIIVTFGGDTSAGIRAYSSSPDTELIWEYTILEADYRWRERLDKWDVYFEVGPVVTHVDGFRDGLVLFCQSGFCQMPRGLVMLDAHTGELIWSHWFASAAEVCYEVITSSGQRLLIVGTSSQANGSTWQGSHDNKCYLYAVMPETGEEAWRREFPGPFARVLFRPLAERSGLVENLLVLYGSSSKANAPAALMLIDAENGNTSKSTNLPLGLVSEEMHFSSSSNEDTWKLYVTSLGGGLRVYDENLSQILMREDIASVLTMGDWIPPIGVELIVRTNSAKTLYLDESLKTIATFDFKSYFEAQQKFAEYHWPIIWVAGNDTHKKFTIKQNTSYAFDILVLILLPLVLVCGATWLSIWSVRTRRAYVKARNEKLVLEGWAQTASFQAHDTKKPIAVILRAIDNLEARTKRDAPNLDIGPFVKRVRGEVSRMLQTSRQIQVVSRVTKPSSQHGNLNELISETVERMNSLDIAPVEFEKLADLLMMKFDRRLIESMLENLIGNAMEAVSPPEGVVVVSAQLSDHERTGVQIVVQDNGKGMTDEEIKEILDGKGSKKKGGQGLGLLCAKWIAETHYGELNVDSKPGLGTTITVYIPEARGEL